MKKKIILSILALIVLVIIGVWFFVIYAPTTSWYWGNRNIAREKGITVTATAISQAYTNNEDSANKLYLNKAIQVTGETSEVKKTEDGKLTVTLKGADAFSGVYCTLKDSTASVQNGATVTLKGICTGHLSDVVIIDAIIVK